ncbi:MAG: elongation factor G, partial [Chitinivibrionales bacterium]|nr:elongation factor G [Chitinivibrionales bacterium]
DIPSELRDEALERRHELIDAVSLFSDELAEAFLEERETEEQVRAAIRAGTLSTEFTPVLVGTAFKNKGVQPLMDAVVDYLPNPAEVRNVAHGIGDGAEEVELVADPERETVALAFKLEEGRYGQLTYVRVYQGSITKGDELTNARTGNTLKVGRLIRMHADSMEDITEASSGEIVALFGVDCMSGDTFTSGGLRCTLSDMHVPEPVISLAIKAADKQSNDNLSKALHRFAKEDPTFKTYVDEESGQTIIKGMGELHLDVYLERIRREYRVAFQTGEPQVAYRETISETAAFDYTHKKQTGGAGQYARVCGLMEPYTEDEYEFADETKGGVIPREYVPSCDRGFRSCLAKGSAIGFPIVNIKVTVNDGNHHPVDSSDLAFHTASIGAFRQAYERAKPIVLEPIMKVSVEGPSSYQGNVLSSINQRRGIIISTSENENNMRVDAEVPLSEMFGYSTVLRSLTQGKAEFTMEFEKYARVPESIASELRKAYAEKRK